MVHTNVFRGHSEKLYRWYNCEHKQVHPLITMTMMMMTTTKKHMKMKTPRHVLHKLISHFHRSKMEWEHAEEIEKMTAKNAKKERKDQREH